MKTQDKSILNNVNLGEKSFYQDNYLEGFNPNYNNELMVGKYKRTNKKYYYDNSKISQSYGESNIEKCLVGICCIIILTLVLSYVYYDFFISIKLYLLVACVFADSLTCISYIKLLINIKKEGIFQKVYLNTYSYMDVIMLFNYFNKVALVSLIYLDSKFYYFWCLIFFSFKFLLETYFVMISLKMFMLSPCMVKLQESFESLWINIKYYILCCEVDEPDYPDYTKLEELESYY